MLCFITTSKCNRYNHRFLATWTSKRSRCDKTHYFAVRMGASGSVLSDSEQAVARNLANKPAGTGKRSLEPCPVFVVSLAFWPSKTVKLPDTFKLRISYESLDFVTLEDETPIIQFPFQNIICWGSSYQNFQFKLFDLEKMDKNDDRDAGILISLKTTQGKIIEDTTMSTVQKLMVDINQRAISKQEFSQLIATIFDESGETLKENWLQIIDQFTSSGRLFLAKQGMELLLRVGTAAPFEKFDLACLLYERIVNKDSFQLLINTFDDIHERENLIHRLKLNASEVVANCAIMPEK